MAPGPWRILAVRALAAAPLALAAPFVVAGFELLERGELAQLAPALSRAFFTVGVLGPLLVGVVALVGARARGDLAALELLGHRRPALALPIFALAALTALALWAAAWALPDPIFSEPVAHQATPDGAAWVLQGPDGAARVDPQALTVEPWSGPAFDPRRVALGWARASRWAWPLHALLGLALLPLFWRGRPGATRASLLSASAAWALAVLVAWTVAQAICGLLVVAGALSALGGALSLAALLAACALAAWLTGRS